MLNRGLEIVDVPYKEIQVAPEPSQLNMSCNRKFLEFLSGQLGKAENVIIAILPGFAAGSRPVGDDGDRLTGTPDAVDEEIDVLLRDLKGVACLFKGFYGLSLLKRLTQCLLR